MHGRPLAFLFANAGSYRLQRSVMECCRRNGRPFVLIYAGGNDTTAAEARQEADDWDAELIVFGEEEDTDRPPVPALEGAQSASFLINRAARRRAAAIYQAHRRTLLSAGRILERLAPAALVVSEDGVSSPLVIINAARHMGIPVVDIPYGNADAGDFERDLDRKRRSGDFVSSTGFDGWLVRLLGRQWVKSGRHSGALMFQPGYILALEAAGVTLRNAWIVHGGLSDILCVDNEIGLRQYRREGIPEAKLRNTGSPYCDALLEGLSGDAAAAAALRRPRKIVPGRTRILVSWPPSYHDTCPGTNEFPDYPSMTRTVLSSLRALPGVDLTVSLHPACGEELVPLLAELGIEPATEYLLPLIPRHDLFVTYSSSTIRWALASGKPVVNYDAYAAELTTYDSAPGFLNAARFAEVRAQVEQLAASDEAFAALASAQIAVADEWGVLDGRCIARILAEIDALIAGRAGASYP